MNTADRRERLLRILMVNGRTTVKELAQRLGVSERTILRDIEILSLTKPIYTVGGRGGGVYILDTYNANRVYMQPCDSDLLNKIIFDMEQTGNCSLSSSEIETLKELVTFYSQPKYVKGKRI